MSSKSHKAQEVLALLERAAVADEVAAAMRHNLRNKLGSIRNASFFLARKAREAPMWNDPKVQRFFTIVDESIDEADEIVSRTFVGVRARRQIQVVPLRDCVERATSYARVFPGVTFDLDVGAIAVEVDPDELALAIRCLLENAAEAMDQHGAVRVSVTAEEASCAISVSDTGPGVPESERENIFLSHRTTKEGHLGIGLNIARRIAVRYGGAVSLLSAPRGATFSLTLKTTSPPARKGAAP